jgi:hypothetical protein
MSPGRRAHAFTSLSCTRLASATEGVITGPRDWQELIEQVVTQKE